MNAILLGAASFGALLAIFTADATQVQTARMSGDVGEMTRTVMVDQATGETTQVSVISFID